MSSMTIVALSKFSPVTGEVRVIVKVSLISELLSSLTVIVKDLSVTSPSAQFRVPVAPI
ncbi:hypothetical protein THIOM_001092 [Candidatus Thiomargarita nelsonii]|uniref:Uncharacterized protein n=1 Tax=Candidatus Thiomargarita nelsonii TaxID=1003181 RepID=A0A176S4P5_9GAMM|nr:hypothetical protein THIOM_001092 [Candidatus Thiomargarita nelsonii]